MHGVPLAVSKVLSSAEACWHEHGHHRNHRCQVLKWNLTMAHLKGKATRHRYGVDFIGAPRQVNFLHRAGEVEEARPTPWENAWFSDACKRRRKIQNRSKYYIFCQPNVPLLYSPSLKIAYMKTPKAASTSFAEHFLTKFNDTVMGTARELDLPEDTFVFTFVRNPMAQKLAAYAEIDIVYQEKLFPHRKPSMHTTFQWVDRHANEGRSRFVAFLNDIRMKRFGQARPSNWSPSHFRSQLAAPVCGGKIDFIGHLEHLEADWRAVQMLAKIPEHLRTQAIRVDHTADQSEDYTADEKIDLGASEKRQLCDLFKADFICLGYEAPPECKLIRQRMLGNTSSAPAAGAPVSSAWPTVQW